MTKITISQIIDRIGNYQIRFKDMHFADSKIYIGVDIVERLHKEVIEMLRTHNEYFDCEGGQHNFGSED